MSGLALTFDDGPDPEWTGRLLDLLADVGAHATFFPIAPRAAAEPELIDRMLADGHRVGLHCHEHVRHTDRDLDWLRRDTTEALAILTSLGADVTCWRTPWGVSAPWTPVVAREHGLDLIDWTVDTHDWRGDGATEMFAATRSALCAGAIVLAHDGIGPGALRGSAAATVAYVALVAELADERGFSLEPVGTGAAA